jgi:hypothetical protein
MNVDELILVSVDDHVVEPPDMFEGRVESRYRDDAPRIVTREDGSQVWTYDGNLIPNIALSATAGRPKEEYGMDPTSFAEMRPGAYDVNARVKDMTRTVSWDRSASRPFRSSVASSSPGRRITPWVRR